MDGFVESVANNVTVRVRDALRETKKLLGVDDFIRRLRDHSEPDGGIGAVYPMKIERLETELMTRLWYSYNHPNRYGCSLVARTNFPGKVGSVDIFTLPASTLFTLVDPKKTGHCALLLEGTYQQREVDFSTIILDTVTGREIIMDFQPGDPLFPCHVGGLRHGDVVSLAKAKELGFKRAKVV